MKVYLNRIAGIDDALVSLYMSKRSWTREKELELREQVANLLTPEGFLRTDLTADQKKIADTQFEKLRKYGIEFGHTTLLRFIDLSYTVEGLHRGAQDDFDAHTKRLDNRIVRSSTRLATFDDGEISDYYKDKIRFPYEVAEKLGLDFPDKVKIGKQTFVRGAYGYIDQKWVSKEEEKDVRRGLYPLGISSNFIFKVQYPELCHIVQHRDVNSHANPELKSMIEMLKSDLTAKFPLLGQNLTILKHQRH